MSNEEWNKVIVLLEDVNRRLIRIENSLITPLDRYYYEKSSLNSSARHLKLDDFRDSPAESQQEYFGIK